MDPVAALARNPGIRPLTVGPSAAATARLRPALTGRISAADTGLVLGDLQPPAGRGPVLYASWEDTLIAFIAPPSGKTTALGVPHVLSAPGPAVATSIKPDLWAATAGHRAAAGPVWLFDPQRHHLPATGLRGGTRCAADHQRGEPHTGWPATSSLTVEDSRQARAAGGRPRRNLLDAACSSPPPTSGRIAG